MRTEQALALIALILGIIGGVLLIGGGVGILLRLLEGNVTIKAETLLITSIGIVAIVASVIIWTGRYVAGGSINIALGVLMVLYGEVQQGLIILISGILGIIAPKIED
ncbi:MAG: hypothetical protein OEY24_05465 [Candidatus Bathyarchaeota archaeon]|nr:hypothetical protein [Candidatus Bathyarchaeota archaeon]MDH5495132.1 hypothetical protein [Candidatus Bathyarchaeota archaeon]